ncbi:MAG: hypothetical protein BRD28_05335, partial [Bacteroidetes bacterium QH_10_64_37]
MAERNQAAEISVGIKCRVAVEKIITSALSSLCVRTFGSMVPSLHDLEDLVEMCPEVDPDYLDFEIVCAELSGYAV